MMVIIIPPKIFQIGSQINVLYKFQKCQKHDETFFLHWPVVYTNVRKIDGFVIYRMTILVLVYCCMYSKQKRKHAHYSKLIKRVTKYEINHTLDNHHERKAVEEWQQEILKISFS